MQHSLHNVASLEQKFWQNVAFKMLHVVTFILKTLHDVACEVGVNRKIEKSKSSQKKSKNFIEKNRN